jgi:hypothetical protein
MRGIFLLPGASAPIPRSQGSHLVAILLVSMVDRLQVCVAGDLCFEYVSTWGTGGKNLGAAG